MYITIKEIFVKDTIIDTEVLDVYESKFQALAFIEKRKYEYYKAGYQIDGSSTDQWVKLIGENSDIVYRVIKREPIMI